MQQIALLLQKMYAIVHKFSILIYLLHTKNKINSYKEKNVSVINNKRTFCTQCL